jgi:biotin carboxyl carrier protein
MSEPRDLEIRIGDEVIRPAAAWGLEWIDRRHGVALARRDGETVPLLVEGSGSRWTVTLQGRRIPVEVRTWRERVLAEAEVAARTHDGPVTVLATLPGLIVAVGVAVGDEVEAGSPLLTIEAMKMQNEVRAPRAGRVIEVSVASGQAVATGAVLLRLG